MDDDDDDDDGLSMVINGYYWILMDINGWWWWWWTDELVNWWSWCLVSMGCGARHGETQICIFVLLFLFGYPWIREWYWPTEVGNVWCSTIPKLKWWSTHVIHIYIRIIVSKYRYLSILYTSLYIIYIHIIHTPLSPTNLAILQPRTFKSASFTSPNLQNACFSASAKAMSGQDDPFVMEQMARLSGAKWWLLGELYDTPKS